MPFDHYEIVSATITKSFVIVVVDSDGKQIASTQVVAGNEAGVELDALIKSAAKRAYDEVTKVSVAPVVPKKDLSESDVTELFKDVPVIVQKPAVDVAPMEPPLIVKEKLEP